MIGAIAGATFVVHDLAACEEAYRDLLGYKVVSRSDVTQADAERWHAPLITGAPMITMYPASGEPVFLRFIEDRETIAHPALTTHGWIAAEMAVQDVEALAVRLRDSVFSIIGPPAILDGFPMIKAMQVVGPGGECLYLTEVGPGAPMHLAPAQSFVGRIFIAVAGGHALDEARHGYARVGNAVSETVPVVSVVVANANDMDHDHATSIALVTLDEGTLLELDRLPDSAGHRPRPIGKLAHGFAVLSCFSSQVDRPHMMIGGFGEMIELLPSPPRPA